MLSTVVLAHHVTCERFDEGCRHKTDSNGRLFEFLREVSMGKETFQLTMDYLKKKSDLKKQKEVFDEKQKASYALFRFPWAFIVSTINPLVSLS